MGRYFYRCTVHQQNINNNCFSLLLLSSPVLRHFSLSLSQIDEHLLRKMKKQSFWATKETRLGPPPSPSLRSWPKLSEPPPTLATSPTASSPRGSPAPPSSSSSFPLSSRWTWSNTSMKIVPLSPSLLGNGKGDRLWVWGLLILDRGVERERKKIVLQ